jgi:hypothetical protein
MAPRDYRLNGGLRRWELVVGRSFRNANRYATVMGPRIRLGR